MPAARHAVRSWMLALAVMARKLTGKPLGATEPAPYDGMWVLTLRAGGEFSLVRLRYGAKAAG